MCLFPCPLGLLALWDVVWVSENDFGRPCLKPPMCAGSLKACADCRPQVFVGAIPDLAQAVEEYGSRQGITRLALIESPGDPPSKRWIPNPFERE
jgi:hypothetical protein